MSDRLPDVSSDDAIKAFEKIGFRVLPGRGKGSHTMMARDAPRVLLTIPRRRSLRPGTLRSLIRAAGLDVRGFLELL